MATHIRNDEAAAVRTRFVCDFYSQIRKQTEAEKNIMLAPTTLGSALAMILIGSNGRTKEQIISSLFRDLRPDVNIDSAIQAYANPLSRNNSKIDSKTQVVLHTVSKLYGENSYELSAEFTEHTRHYGMEMEKADFAGAPDTARKIINEWVSEATKGVIRDLFDAETITNETKLAIVTAIYFEGTWERQFHKTSTRPGNFHVRVGQTVKVDFMEENHIYKVHSSDLLDASLLELPYLSDDCYNASMVIILPRTSMEYTEDKLNGENLMEALSALFSNTPGRRYEISIPKFEITADYQLISILSGMGMKDLVSASLADLSAMVLPDKTTDNSPYVKAAVHKTILKVNEAGTIGAGASGFSLVPCCVPGFFKCDHPFLTIVYEKKSQTVIFIGRIMNPPPYLSA